MKRIITLCFFAFAFMICTHNAGAQNVKDIDQYSQAQSQEVKKLLNLNEAQTQVVWRAFYARAKGYMEGVDGKDLSNKSVQATKERIDGNFKRTLLRVLSQEQMTQLNSWLAKPKY